MQTFSYGSQEYEPEYQIDNSRQQQSATARRTRRSNYGRSGNRPVAVNGIHRRRNKRWSW